MTNGTLAITSARLFIGGEEVYAVGVPPAPPLFVYDVAVGTMFDSTHFDHGEEVEVRLTVTDSDGDTTSNSFLAPVYNKAIVFGRFDMEVDPLTFKYFKPPGQDPPGEYVSGDSSWGGTIPAFNRLSGSMNSSVFGPETGKGWTAYGFLTMCEIATLAYVTSHGGVIGPLVAVESDVMDSHYWYDTVPPEAHPDYTEEYITGTYSQGQMYQPVYPGRVVANGSGLPPFNTGVPPINLAWMDACKSGVLDNQPSQDFAQGFLYPYGNFYAGTGTFPEDQAYCGYLIDVDFDRTNKVSDVFFLKLQQGFTVNRAREISYVAAYSGADDDPGDAHLWMAVYGGWATRIHGVYTGVDEDYPVWEWRREIAHP